MQLDDTGGVIRSAKSNLAPTTDRKAFLLSRISGPLFRKSAGKNHRRGEAGSLRRRHGTTSGRTPTAED
jgi:hypothetical protein